MEGKCFRAVRPGLVSLEGIGESRLDVFNYEGSKLSAYHIYAVLKVAMTEDWVETLEKLHQNRKNNWKAEMLVSPEGKKEYRLYTTRQNDPVCSSVIAISDNQIHNFSILSEDAAPLLKKSLRIILRSFCHATEITDTLIVFQFFII